MHIIIARKERLLAEILLFALSLAPTAWAETVTLFDGRKVFAVLYDTDSGAPIQKAANLLAHDLNALSGLTACCRLTSTWLRLIHMMLPSWQKRPMPNTTSVSHHWTGIISSRITCSTTGNDPRHRFAGLPDDQRWQAAHRRFAQWLPTKSSGLLQRVLGCQLA
ncbi:MAG TPA: hypothetical protein VFU86_18335 [Terriglobales bacterium]|nr:hypothetical protein [Terriglobales bacterium]